MASQPRLVRSAPAVGAYVDPLSVSADGERIAVPDYQGAVHLYDAATSALLRSYRIHERPELGLWAQVEFSPLDEYLAVGTDVEPWVRLLDPRSLAETGLELDVPEDRGRARVSDVDFSADGRYLAAAMQRKPPGLEIDEGSAFVVVWDLRSSARTPALVRTDETRAQGLALSPDGQTVYTSWPLTAYDVATGRKVWSTDVESFVVLDISPDGRLLASEIHQKEPGPVAIRLTDAHTGKARRILRGHNDQPRDLRFSDDGKRLASASHDGQLIVWQVSTGEPLVVADTLEISWSVDFSPDSRLVYTGGDDGTLRTWDLYGDEQFLRRKFGLPGGQFVDISSSVDGTRLAFITSGKRESSVDFLDTVTGKRTSIVLPGEILGEPWSPAAWHPDGWHYAVYGPKGVVTLLDARSGRRLQRQRVVEGSIYSMDYIDQGERLIVGDDESRVRFVDAETLRPSGPGFEVASDCCAAGSPDGGTAMLFDDSPDGAKETWRVIDTKSGEVLNEGELDLRATSAEFSPDGDHVAITGNSGEVVSIDVASGRVTRSPAGHAADGDWVRWSPGGSRIVSGAADGSVSLWDGDSLDLLGTVVIPYETDPGPVSPTFTTEEEVTLASYDGHVYRWDTTLDHALAFACQMAGRNLSPTEWEAALPALPYEETCPSS